MKKWTALLLALVLCVAFALPAFAANGDETAEPQACSHTYGSTTTSTYYEYYNSSQCKRVVVKTRVCTKCAYIDRTETSTLLYHGETVHTATCDGATQTWKYHCPNCGVYRYTTWKACPGAGKSHTNGCLWLPI